MQIHGIYSAVIWPFGGIAFFSESEALFYLVGLQRETGFSLTVSLYFVMPLCDPVFVRKQLPPTLLQYFRANLRTLLYCGQFVFGVLTTLVSFPAVRDHPQNTVQILLYNAVASTPFSLRCTSHIIVIFLHQLVYSAFSVSAGFTHRLALGKPLFAVVHIEAKEACSDPVTTHIMRIIDDNRL